LGIVVSRGKNSEEGEQVCYGHPVFQHPIEEKLIKQDLLGFRALGN